MAQEGQLSRARMEEREQQIITLQQIHDAHRLALQAEQKKLVDHLLSQMNEVIRKHEFTVDQLKNQLEEQRHAGLVEKDALQTANKKLEQAWHKTELLYQQARDEIQGLKKELQQRNQEYEAQQSEYQRLNQHGIESEKMIARLQGELLESQRQGEISREEQTQSIRALDQIKEQVTGLEERLAEMTTLYEAERNKHAGAQC
jgi:chromosome segregation ATPase